MALPLWLLFSMKCFVYFQFNQRMKFSSTKDLRIFASDISSNEDFKNAEFKRLLKPLLIPRMPDTENSRVVQSVSRKYI